MIINKNNDNNNDDNNKNNNDNNNNDNNNNDNKKYNNNNNNNDNNKKNNDDNKNNNNNNNNNNNSKYKDLEIKRTRMWGMKTETVPVVIGAVGLIKKGLEKHTEKIPGAININELQKNTLLGTAHTY